LIHHIAIATPQLTLMSEFYKTLPGLTWKEDKFTETGDLRSVWFEVEGTSSILMLEKFPYSKAPEALIFQMNSAFQNYPVQISKQTEYTIYFLDPDKNQLGYSSYPIKMSVYLKLGR
jgi:catechol 2,3-dioxygenase-like lactoylglutathione lyase family enzyme